MVSSLIKSGYRRGVKVCGGLLKSHGAGGSGEVGGSGVPLEKVLLLMQIFLICVF